MPNFKSIPSVEAEKSVTKIWKWYKNSQSPITPIKSSKSKFWNILAKLQVVTNMCTKFQQNRSSGYRGVAITKLYYGANDKKRSKSNNSHKIIRIKMKKKYWVNIMLKLYTKFQINPFSRSWDICSDGRMDWRTDGRTDGLTDGRTRWLQYSPLSKEWGYNIDCV